MLACIELAEMLKAGLSLLTSHLSPITNHQSPVTSHFSLLTFEVNVFSSMQAEGYTN
jgi:hypothetical protein